MSAGTKAPAVAPGILPASTAILATMASPFSPGSSMTLAATPPLARCRRITTVALPSRGQRLAHRAPHERPLRPVHDAPERQLAGPAAQRRIASVLERPAPQLEPASAERTPG